MKRPTDKQIHLPGHCCSTNKGVAPLLRGLLLSVVLSMTVGIAQVCGQSALDGYDPNANGDINVVVVQPDGKILIGGTFTTLSPNGGATVTRNRIARLNADGTVDSAFDPNANNTVNAIAVQADGKILVGGTFNGSNSIGGQTRNRIARLNGTTGSADSFNPNANGSIFEIAVQLDAKILVGGTFTSIGGQTRNRIARLDATGLADSFNPNASSSVFALAVQLDGKVVVGGLFTSIGGQARNRIARVKMDGTLDTTFNPNANSSISSIALQADGKILVGGAFTTIGGLSRNFIARLTSSTGTADSFDPDANGTGIGTIAVQPDGQILIGGDFTTLSPNGGATVPRSRIARLNPTGTIEAAFDPNPNGNAVFSVAVQPDRKIVIGGNFTSVRGNARNRIARLETDGRLDQTLNLNLPTEPHNYVGPIALQPNGSILIGGLFTSVLGVPRNNMARLHTDGTLDTAFDPNPTDPNSNLDDDIFSMAVQADGKILVGGRFSNIGGQTRHFIARVNATTGAADSFDPDGAPDILSIAVQADSKILVGGPFGTIGGQTRNGIARLDPTGFVDAFDPNASPRWVESIAVQPDQQILAGGRFTFIGGQTRNHIARLNWFTGLADAFDPNADDDVASVLLQPDGKILVGGYFHSIGGQPRRFLARLDTTGVADSFNPPVTMAITYTIGLQADGKVLAGAGGVQRLDPTTGSADSFNPAFNASLSQEALALEADGKILVGGYFDTVGGETRHYFCRLSNDTAALQNLAVTQTAITWTLGGSSPQFHRVTFESSPDNSLYTLLGNATSNGNNWSLTALHLPTDQNFFIRARGYYRTGQRNGSESIEESVRNAFIPTPPAPSQIVSRKSHGGAGTFDVALPLAGNAGIECRSGGTGNDYQIIFTFPNAVTFTNATLSSGTGSVINSSGNGTTTATVNLTGVTNAQKILVTLQGASDGTNAGNIIVPMTVLIGDTVGNGNVNASDVTQTGSRVGQTTNASNFRSDVNANGSINASDVSLVKSRVGTPLP
jgi:uncharacterized delta-60 repeat protein